MNLNEYQDHARVTLLPQCNNLQYLVLGLVGEAGEIANKAKKVLRGDYDEDDLKQMLLGEIGDVLYYAVMLAEWAGYEADDVAQFNVQKLARRKVDGKIKGNGDSR